MNELTGSANRVNVETCGRLVSLWMPWELLNVEDM